MMDKAPYLFLMILVQLKISHAQFRGCPSLSDPNSLRRLIAHTIAGNYSSATLPSVAIRKNHTVCLSVGPESGTFSSISLLVEYECSGHMGCSPSNVENNITVEQFDFGCTHSYTWSAVQFGETGSRIPTANFSTALRRDCSACIEKEVADAVGLSLLFQVDPTSRCLACSSGCTDVGMGLCFGLGANMCCNYFLNDTCVNLCPNDTQPDSNFICQKVVVGFERKVYFAEEGQALVLPVVVKEGNLTQRVVLKVNVQLQDSSTTVGEDYRLSKRRVELIPGVSNNTGKVKLKIVNDHYPEEDEQLLVQLELKTGSALVDYHSAMVVIIGDGEEPEVNITTPPPPTPIENGCQMETDDVWGLHWPTAAEGSTITITCGRGSATRKCLPGAIWATPNVSFCENKRIAEIGDMATELFSEGDVQPDEALVVVSELLEATETTFAISESPHGLLPRDLNTTSTIIAHTVDILLQSINNSHAVDIEVNDTVVVLDILSYILTDQNQDGFANLHSEGTGTGSTTVLNSAEKYGLYVGQALADNKKEEKVFISRENLVLHSERKNSDDFEPGKGHTDLTFPGMDDLPVSISVDSVPASVTIPGALLDKHYEGNLSITSLFFSDLHNLLPAVFDNGTVPRSFVISSQIYGERIQPPNSYPFQDIPITLTFRLKLNNTEKSPRCAFWDFSNGIARSGWSTEGVRTESVTREGDIVTVTCVSLHLTSFAVLVDVGGARIDHKALEIVTYIGISISIPCLFLTIIFFGSIGKKLLTTVHNLVHLNLSIALFVAYIIFALGVEVAASNEAACKAVTALIQYFLLSAFCWMMCEGIMLYLMLVVVFSKLIEKWWLFLLGGWGPPLIFVAIGLSTALDEYGVRDSDGELLYCWLASGSDKHAIWTFVGPMLAIIAINTVFLVLVLHSIYISKTGQDTRKNKPQCRHALAIYIVKASVILLPLLGLTWLFGLFALNENTAIFAWLFTIFNSLQGCSIFVLHVVRNDRVWGRMRKSFVDPDSFLRSRPWSTYSRRTISTSGSTSGSTRFSKPRSAAADSGDVDMELHQGVNDGSMIESHSSESLEDVLEQPKATEDVFELQDIPEDVKDMWKPPRATKDVLEPPEAAKNILEPPEPTQNVLEPLQRLPKICQIRTH